MKKIFSLFAILICLAGNVWGQDDQPYLKVTPVQALCNGEDGMILVEPFNFQPGSSITIRVSRQGLTSMTETIVYSDGVKIEFEVPRHTTYDYSVSVVGSPSIEVVSDGKLLINFNPPSLYIELDDTGVDCPFPNLTEVKGRAQVSAGGGVGLYQFAIVQTGGSEPEEENYFKTDENYYMFSSLSRDYLYIAYVKDANGCTSNTADDIEFSPYTPMSLNTFEIDGALCNGDDSEVTITVTGGTQGSNSIWFVLNEIDDYFGEDILIGGEMQFGTSFSGLKPTPEDEVDVIIVYDLDGCMFIKDFIIEEPVLPKAIIKDVTDRVCYGTDTGSFTVEVEVESDKPTPIYTFSYESDHASPLTGSELGVKNENNKYAVSFSGLVEGIYTVTGTDGTCPVIIYQGSNLNIPNPTVTLTDKDPVRFTATQGNSIICVGGSDATIVITNTSAYPDKDMEYKLKKDGVDYGDGDGWQTAPLFEGLSSGTYIVTGKADGCEWIYQDEFNVPIEIVIEDPNPVEVTGGTGNPPSCHDGGDGSIDGLTAASINGGPYEFSIVSFNSGSEWEVNWQTSFSNLEPGAYLIKAKDKEGCISPAEKQLSITIPNPVEVSFAVAGTDPVCPGTTGGSITISSPSYPNTGHPNWELLQLEYKLEKKLNEVFEPVSGYEGDEGFVTGTNFTGLTEGTYRITGRIKGKNCDPYIQEFPLKDPDNPITVEFKGKTDVTCFGENNGTITFTTKNVAINVWLRLYKYSYKNVDEDDWSDWLPADNSIYSTDYTTPASLNLGPGVYEIRIQEIGGNKCISLPFETEIIEPPLLVVTATPTNTICPNTTDGKISVEIEGGTPYSTGNDDLPYRTRYFSTAQTINSINFNTYYSQDSEFDISPLSPSPIAAGQDYYVYVRDGNNCRTSAIANVKTAQPITADPSVLQTPNLATCHTDAGNVILTVQNVTGEADRDLEYYIKKSTETNWGLPNTNTPVNEFTGLGIEGETTIYDVKVKYAIDETDLCPLNRTHTLIIPAPITINLTDSTSLLCNNGTNGTITVEASGGYQGTGSKYLFKLETSPTGSDRNTDHWLESNVLGGSGFQLTHVGPDTTFIFTAKRVYGALEEDACDAAVLPIISKRLANPDELTLSMVGYSQYLCSYNEGTGHITVKASGGTLGNTSPDDEYIYKLYQYNHNESKYDDSSLAELSFILNTPAVFSDLDSGTYKIVVFDMNDCSQTITDVVIKRFDKIEPVIKIRDVSCYGDADGSVDLATITITGGSGSYQQPYQWRKWNEMTNLYDIVIPNPTDLPSGKYALIVTDTEGCIDTHEFVIEQPREIEISVNTSPITCTGSDGSLKISASGGGYTDADVSYSYSIDGGYNWMNEEDFENLDLEPGEYHDLGSTTTYHIRVRATYTKDSKGNTLPLPVSCIAIGDPVTFAAVGKFEIFPSNPNVANILCPNITNPDDLGKITVTARGGKPVVLPDEYIFKLYIYDYLTNKYVLSGTPQLSAGVFTELDSSMYKPYRILASDANSCQDSVFVTVERPKKIEFTAEETLSVLPCDNAVTDIVLDITSSDPGPFVYRVNEKDGDTGTWSIPFTATSIIIPNVGKGEYIIEVAYDSGKNICENHDIQTNTPYISITVDELEFIASKINPACFKEYSGMVVVTTAVPVNTLRLYQWNSETEDFELTTHAFFTPSQHTDLENIPGITGGFIELPEGKYQVRAVANGCLYESSILDLVDPPLLYPNILSTINPCNGQTNGVIRIEAEGGTPEYTFEIHTLNPATNQFQVRRTIVAEKEAEFINLGQNTYYIRIVDKNGCNTRHLPVDGLPFYHPDPLVALFAEGDITNVTCNEGDDGKASVTVTGGRKQYTYIWNLEKEAFDLKPPIIRETLVYEWEKLDDSGFVFTFENDSTVTGLPAGDYKVKVRQDVCNLSAEKTFTITEPDELTIIINDSGTKGGMTCNNIADGQITVETSGGTPKETPSGEPLRYFEYTVYLNSETDSWDKFDTAGKTIEIEFDSETNTETYTLKGLESGKYKIEVDDEVCTPTSVEVEIINPEPFIVRMSKENVSCSDQTDGSINVTIEGGVVPYHITVEDNDGVVRGPLEIDPDTYAYVPNDDYLVSISEGKVEVSFTGLPGGSKENPEKTYHVIVQTDNGCELKEDHTIVTPEEFVFKLSVGAAGSILQDTIYLCNPGDRVPFTPSYGGVNASITELWRDGVKMPSVPDPLRVSQPGTYYGVARSVVGGCISISNEVYVLLYEPSADFRKHDETCSIPGSIKIVNPSGGINNPGLNFVYRVFDVDNNTYLSDNFNQYPNDSIRILAGNYYVEMRSHLEEICPNTILRIPLETADPNFITINTINTIDLSNPSDWYITTDPTCFSGFGRIKVFNPINDIADNIIFRIYDKDDNDVAWLTLTQVNLETEFNMLPVGKYFLDIEDEHNGCKKEKIPFEIGTDLPRISVKFVSDEILDFLDCEQGYIEFVVELSDPKNSLTLDDLTISHTNLTGDLLFTASNDEPVTDDNMMVVGYRRTYGAYLAGSGKTTVRVAVSDNCYTEKENSFNVPEKITLDYTLGASECFSSSIVVSFTINGGEGAIYTLLGLGDPVSITATVDHKNTIYIKELNEGEYNVSVKDATGCQSDVIEVVVESPEQVNPDLVDRDESEGMATCENSVNGFIRLSDNHGYTYKWENDMDGNMLPNVGKGIYKVVISKGNCAVETSYEVKVANTIEVSITGNGGGGESNEFCPGDNVLLVGTIKINGATWTPSTDILGASASWMIPPDGDTQEFLSNIPLSPIPATNAKVQLLASYLTSTNNITCTNSAEFEIKTAPLPTIEFQKDIIYIPQEFEFNLEVTTSPFESCTWTAIPDFGQTQNLDCPPYAGILTAPREPYELILTLMNEFGCELSKSVFVEQALDFFIPNAFTPNEDGFHDTWKFRNIEQYEDIFDIQVVVFNRGGTPIWEGKGYDNYNVVWDGRRNGQDVPIGTYWYVVKFVPKKDGATITRTGSVTVIR